ncbi:asparagine synthase (glutamine-hydrolyzing) [Ammoniphilus sp. CFH 90114]|uniref:asparagine synthase (glutamine-hydrolyzing) n=1 Tax=Ammoniphilus sp. CFH 90114 TaxID=2493665 RepID=UPI00100E56C2|nr:asparagine synthase (glutamine-hydrolyzing) [Ammoniphilus sp. CFH 90114]RXT04202.1 asparagine synthase (glutamine-hydrolyzing) [Ammoniphilus sp. CFH 90114]
MCGITGWINWQRNLNQERELVRNMTKTLYNRGPDAEGIWLSEHAAFGHRRLVVVDPEGGAQPMTRQLGDQEYTMVYNGELYNTEDIRRELIDRGYRFRSHSDTEVLLTSFMEWGERCLEKLNGIFAFAIWDQAQQRLFMARDRLGVKPLFYTQSGSSFLFASELKSLLAHPEVEPVIDREGLNELLIMGPSRTPGNGIFRGVKELLPGHYLTYDRNQLKTGPYWTLTSKPHEENLEDTTERVRELFMDSVKRQLVADVPVCTLLSGGLDSSAITAIAAETYKEEGKGPLHTFSVDYVGNERYFKSNEYQPNADAPWIKRVSDYFGTVHHSITIDTHQLVDALKDAVRLRDLPGMADIDASLYLFCKEIKKEATVALSGECADEVFGGYPWFHRPELWSDQQFPWTRNIDFKLGFYSSEVKQELTKGNYMAERYQEAIAEVSKLGGEKTSEEKAREMFHLNLTRWMPTLLDRKDRMSMGVGLEVRVPFCDHRLVEYAWNIPWEMKTSGDREKGLLRRALQGILPDDILTRKKSPYPKTHHPAYLEATKNWLLEILEDPHAPIQPLIHKESIQSFMRTEDLTNLHVPWFGQLMNVPQWFAYLAQMNTWMEEYKVKLV